MLESLTMLDTLRLSSNEFTGSIPSEIGLLTLLEELKLDENKLDGRF
jgi:Leucine-rich repeat (LRR) protein